MTAPLPTRPPSWAPPIALGALVSVLGVLGVVFVSGLLGNPSAAFAVLCCGTCSTPLLFGVLPPLVALARDPDLSPGQGFAVTFIGVGAGLIALAGWAVLSMTPEDMLVIEDQLRQELEAQRNEGLAISDQEIEEQVDMTRRLFPYVVPLMGLAGSLLAGMIGAVTVSVLRGRRLPPTERML